MKTPRTILVLITVTSLLITHVATAQALRPLPSGFHGAVNGSHAPFNTTADILSGNLPCGTDSTLVGCWQMEENGGTVLLDGSSYANNATLYGGPAWVTGIGGSYAIDLNGTSQYALVPDNASLDIEDQITIMAWIRPEQYATQDLIKKATQGAVNGYELSLATTKTDATSQRVFFRINQLASGDTYRVNATTMYPIDGTWMHVAATYDGSVMRLYINGVQEGGDLPVPPEIKIALNNVPLSIGAQSTPSRYFKGWMDDARVYHRALSPEEIEAFINFPPVAVDDAYGTPEDTLLTVPAPGVLSNDTDAEMDPLTAIKVTDPAHGILTLNPDGSFTYEPEANWNGSDSFTYKANDTQVDSNTATVTVTVSAVDDPPEVTDPGSQANAEGDVISLQITATDLDSPALAYSALNLPEGLNIDPASGLISGSISFYAAAGSPYSASVTVTDGTTPVTANFTWTVTQTAFGACAAEAGLVACYQMEEGSGALIYDGSPAGNDGTTAGGPAWVTGKIGSYALTLDGATQSVSITDDDSLDLTTAFTIAGWIKPGKSGTQYLFKKADHDFTDGYELSLSSGTLVFVRVNQKTSGDTYRINSTTAYPIDGNTWMHVAATYSGSTLRLFINGVQEGGDLSSPAPAINTLPLTLGTQATFMRYFQGAMDDVRLYDRALTLDEIQVLAWLKPVVSGIPDQVIPEGTSFTTIALDDYVTDADNSDEQLSWSYSGNASLTVNIVNHVATITIPDADWNGSELITFRATDPGAHWGEDAAYFTVSSVNDGPVLGSIGPRGTAELVPLLFTATATDIDLPADTLTYSLADGDDGSVPAGAGIDPGGDFSWTPTEVQGPGAYTFDVCVSDGWSSDCETITVTISEVATAPVALPDAYEVLQHGTLTVDMPGVLANDSDADIPADTLSAYKVSDPTHGQLLIINTSGLFVYRPTDDYIGMDAFTYRVSDGFNFSEVVSVSIRVYQERIYLPMLVKPFATPVLGLNHIEGSPIYTLSWGAIAGATDYKIWESLSGTFPTEPAYVSGGATSFTLPNLNPTRYYYRIAATNGYMDSQPSNTLPVDRQYELEDNDTSATSNGPLDYNISYYFQPNDLKDYFKIYMATPGTITITVSGYTTSPVWPGQLQLFEEGNPTQPVDSDTFPYEDGMSVSWTGIEENWYYIMIGTGVPTNSNWYHFTVSFTPTP